MARYRRYDPAHVQIELSEERRGTWDWLRRSVSGREFIYAALDRNLDRLNSWTFVVQVPRNTSIPVIVRPREVPARRTSAGIDRKSIAFVRATRRHYRGQLYCKLTLADPTGDQTKFVVGDAERRNLPRWISHSQFKIRLKRTVATTRGRDEKNLVVVVRSHDHVGMIRIFFATKVWVLQEGFLLSGPR